MYILLDIYIYSIYICAEKSCPANDHIETKDTHKYTQTCLNHRKHCMRKTEKKCCFCLCLHTFLRGWCWHGDECMPSCLPLTSLAWWVRTVYHLLSWLRMSKFRSWEALCVCVCGSVKAVKECERLSKQHWKACWGPEHLGVDVGRGEEQWRDVYEDYSKQWWSGCEA